MEFQNGHYSVAKSALERILAKTPSNDRAHFALAECLRHLQDQSGAMAHFKEAVRLKPDEPLYKKELDKLIAKGADMDTVSPRRPGELIPMDSASSAPATHRIDAVSWEARNLISIARVAVLARIDAETSGDSKKIADTDLALKNIRKLPSDPHNEAFDAVTSYHQRGATMAQQGLFGDALASYRKAFSLNPWDAEETLDLVRLEIQNKDWSMAELHCMAAVGLKPTFANNWLDLGLIFLNKHEPQKAEACFAIGSAQENGKGMVFKFLRQALANNSDPSMTEVLQKSVKHAEFVEKGASIGLKNIPSADSPDPMLLAYKLNLLMSLAEKWDQPDSGMVVVATIDRDGKLAEVELLKPSGSKDSDEKAVALLKSVTIQPLPSWFEGKSKRFILNFNKVKSLATYQPAN